MDFNGRSASNNGLTKQLNAKELRTLQEQKAAQVVASHGQKTPRTPLYFILDNVYDTYNIGGLFRLADALNITKMYICGDSETPPNHKIKKASIGTYKVVPWEYKATTLQAIEALRADDTVSENEVLHESAAHKAVKILAIEQDKRSIPYQTYTYDFPIALILGNETRGCSAEVLQACDAIVEMPMFGLNTSLNVIVSAAIVSYHIVMSANTSKTSPA
jgi:tRNA G18 (ribose-2'-O)-methylase SpoU